MTSREDAESVPTADSVGTDAVRCKDDEMIPRLWDERIGATLLFFEL